MAASRAHSLLSIALLLVLAVVSLPSTEAKCLHDTCGKCILDKNCFWVIPSEGTGTCQPNAGDETSTTIDFNGPCPDQEEDRKGDELESASSNPRVESVQPALTAHGEGEAFPDGERREETRQEEGRLELLRRQDENRALIKHRGRGSFSESVFGNVPNEIIFHILSLLPCVHDLKKAGGVCTIWNTLSEQVVFQEIGSMCSSGTMVRRQVSEFSPEIKNLRPKPGIGKVIQVSLPGPGPVKISAVIIRLPLFWQNLRSARLWESNEEFIRLFNLPAADAAAEFKKYLHEAREEEKPSPLRVRVFKEGSKQQVLEADPFKLGFSAETGMNWDSIVPPTVEIPDRRIAFKKEDKAVEVPIEAVNLEGKRYIEFKRGTEVVMIVYLDPVHKEAVYLITFQFIHLLLNHAGCEQSQT